MDDYKGWRKVEISNADAASLLKLCDCSEDCFKVLPPTLTPSCATCQPAQQARAAGARNQPVSDGAFEPPRPGDTHTLLNRSNPIQL